MPAVSSAAGLLALLEEQNDDLKRYALTNLDKVVDEYWFQISGSIASVEALYEDDEFSHRELAALVASKVVQHGLSIGDLRGLLISSNVRRRCSITLANWTTLSATHWVLAICSMSTTSPNTCRPLLVRLFIKYYVVTV